MCYKNITGRFFGLVTKHACNGQTDRQNYDSQDRASIAVSLGKNGSPYAILSVLSVTLVYCGQTVGWIKMKLRMEVGLGPGHWIGLSLGDIVLDGHPAPPKSGTTPPVFGPCLLWPNDWMDQDATWY